MTTISPQVAQFHLAASSWDGFFSEISSIWRYIPGAAPVRFYSKEDMKHSFIGASWSIVKVSYTLE